MMSKNPKVDIILSKKAYNFDDLCLIMEILRGKDGCPWDTEQTHQSIRNNFIEETYEVIEAIDTENIDLLREELGDVMLQVVFHAQMEKEQGTFDINDVANDVCAKLVHRHPHIFGDINATTSEDVLKNWEAIKNIEKSRETLYDKLSSIPSMTPALMRAQKVAKKSGEYKNISTKDLISNLESIISDINKEAEIIDETSLGELLFAICAIASKTEINSEEALYKKINNFIENYKE